jgi:hypothetical protein
VPTASVLINLLLPTSIFAPPPIWKLIARSTVVPLPVGDSSIVAAFCTEMTGDVVNVWPQATLPSLTMVSPL